MILWRHAVFYNEIASIYLPLVPNYSPFLFSRWGYNLLFSQSFLLNYRFLKLACIVVCRISVLLFHSFFTANESLMCQTSKQSLQLSKFMIWCFLIIILRNVGCQLFQNGLGHECVLLICIVFFTAFLSCSIDPCVGHPNWPNYSFAVFYNVYGTIFVYELLRSLLHQSSHFHKMLYSAMNYERPRPKTSGF